MQETPDDSDTDGDDMETTENMENTGNEDSKINYKMDVTYLANVTTLSSHLPGREGRVYEHYLYTRPEHTLLITEHHLSEAQLLSFRKRAAKRGWKVIWITCLVSYTLDLRKRFGKYIPR